MYEEVKNKDWRKGAKEAGKALKKLENLSKENIQVLMDRATLRTANSDYLNGFFDQCRQAQAVA